jgi:RNA polymerase sigma-70 factor (ECF subfamily)
VPRSPDERPDPAADEWLPVPSSPHWHRALVGEFRTACEHQDVVALRGLLRHDVVAITDGGGRVAAALEPVRGVPAVVDLLVHVRGTSDTRLEECAVNGRPGLLLRRGGLVVGVVHVTIDRGWITDVWVVLNPDKLRGWRDR